MICKSANDSSLWVVYGARLESAGLLLRFPAETYLHFFFVCFPFLTEEWDTSEKRHNTPKPIQMKSSMTYIQNNRCIEIKTIEKGGGGIYSMDNTETYYDRISIFFIKG